MKQIIKDRVCYHYKYHYRCRYRCPCDWKSFLKFGTNFRHTAGWFLYVFLRDGPGSGHCLYKQRNTPKQTRLRKALLRYFSRSLRHKGQQGSAIVAALKMGLASRPIFSKVMLSSGKKKWIIALTHHCLVCRFTNALTRRDLYTAQAPNNPRKMARVAKPKFWQEPKQSQSTTWNTLPCDESFVPNLNEVFHDVRSNHLALGFN